MEKRSQSRSRISPGGASDLVLSLVRPQYLDPYASEIVLVVNFRSWRIN